VKIGWFWTTVAFLVLWATHPTYGPSKAAVLTRRRLQGLLRWGLVTLWWIIVTQWFWGPALIDRGFVATGGMCDLVRSAEGREELGEVGAFVTGQACKMAGGTWRGGHDISGHVFLLVLGSAFLGMEMLPVLERGMGVRDERVVVRGDGGVGRAEGVGEEDEGERWGWGVGVGGVVVGLEWWMILMTAVFFHTWVEKVSGIVIVGVVEKANEDTVHRITGGFCGDRGSVLSTKGLTAHERCDWDAGGLGGCG
jgi:hypothetical protein